MLGEAVGGNNEAASPSAAGPTLAVVITSYNYARYLRQTIDSVLAQQPAFDEVVVVDDGSTDNSLDIIAEYAGRLTLLSVANGGHLAACRLALSQTVSDYLYTLDSDDYAVPGLVARLRSALAGRPAKVQFQLQGIDADGHNLNSIFPVYPPGYDAAAMREDNVVLGFYICPPTSGNVFSRRALDQLNLQTFEAKSGFDSAPALAMPYLGEVVSIPEPLAFYRVHVGSDSNWCRPTAAQLSRELRLFRSSWSQVASALELEVGPVSKSGSLYIREREMMLACLENKPFIGTLAWRFIAGLAASHIPVGQKLMLSAWAVALLVPSDRLRNVLMRLKRSSLNRSRSVQNAINALKILSWENARRTSRP